MTATPRPTRNPRRRPAFRCAVFLVAAVLLLVAWPGGQAEAAKRLFRLDDPRGDDHGNGNLVYPLDSDFAKGDLDLLTFTAVREKDGTRFEITFANPIRQPGRGAIDELGTPEDSVARFGFYTFNVDVYIDVDREPGSGAVSLLPGRRAEVDPAFGWERAVILTPRPNVARAQVKDLMMRSLREELKSDEPAVDDEQFQDLKGMIPGEVENRIYFPSRIRVRGSKIDFFVPDDFLGDKASPDWAYVVLVTGADLAVAFDFGTSFGAEAISERMMVLPVGPGTWTDRFGGGRKDDPLQPPIVDMLTPAGAEQELLLNDYDPVRGRPVALPGVVPAAAKGGK
jgi:hypothetical protein